MGIRLYVNRVNDEKSTKITINGLSDIVYKYEDGLLKYEELKSDENGNVEFLQDLSKPHIIFFKV